MHLNQKEKRQRSSSLPRLVTEKNNIVYGIQFLVPLCVMNGLYVQWSFEKAFLWSLAKP